ncbi:putative prolyl 4-hydroxylase 6 [Micractinium conductrix]|uniref:procollagen-proline 4-dioxygenase n=1 Tax=Micractinium conductrix TaxID=554055 RepID=A0A2P6VFV7_9CHLO|nr:putative prolyl 4-hydroxylase 6 [Micractinium conductrix]|eukprot:PSC72973.1 putative prolyl 4-hydroxylase 6 [Micractinium conductrix]
MARGAYLLLGGLAGLCCLLAAPCALALEFGNQSRAWIEVVTWKPRALVLHGFLTDEECDHIVKLAEASLERSKVVSRDGSGKLDAVRTSSGTFLAKGQDELVQRVEARIAEATALPVSHAENLQVLKYELGQEYKAHYDVIETDANATINSMRPQMANPRVATLLMYLTDVDEGGETTFPGGRWIDSAAQAQPPYTECGAKGVAVKPRKGDALLFYSLKVDAQKKDAFSLHAGCPVVTGTKYSATSWIHVSPWGAAPVSKTQPQYGVCKDNDPKCPQWAAAGECDANPVYMRGTDAARGNCRLSCKVCRVCMPGDILCERENERPLCLRVRVADMGQLRHASRLLSSLRCSGLALPCLAGKPLAAQAAAQEFTLGLLSDAVFLRRSGASLAALLGVPLTLVASGALAGSPLPALRHLSLALEPLCQRDCFQAAASLRRSCFPAGLHTVELAASLLVAGLTAEQLPQRLCRLSLTADQQGSLTVGSGALAACPAITARASGTATLLLEQLTVGGGRGCRQLSVRARWAVLSAGGSAPFVGVLAGGGGVEAALLSWLRCLHTVLARSALQRLELVACEVLSYCQSTGRLAKLRLPLWQNPGIVQVAAFGLEARCAWPVPGLPPAYFSLVVTRHKA